MVPAPNLTYSSRKLLDVLSEEFENKYKSSSDALKGAKGLVGRSKNQ